MGNKEIYDKIVAQKESEKKRWEENLLEHLTKDEIATALKIFKQAYMPICKASTECNEKVDFARSVSEKQAKTTAFNCLRIVFPCFKNIDMVTYLEFYAKEVDHLLFLQSYKNKLEDIVFFDEYVFLSSDYSYSQLCIAEMTKQGIEYSEFSENPVDLNAYTVSFVDTEFEPTTEVKEKIENLFNTKSN